MTECTSNSAGCTQTVGSTKLTGIGVFVDVMLAVGVMDGVKVNVGEGVAVSVSVGSAVDVNVAV